MGIRLSLVEPKLYIVLFYKFMIIKIKVISNRRGNYLNFMALTFVFQQLGINRDHMAKQGQMDNKKEKIAQMKLVLIRQ